MSSDSVQIGVVGVGHLGRWHVQQLNLIPEAKICGIFDSDKKRSVEIAKEYNLPSRVQLHLGMGREITYQKIRMEPFSFIKMFELDEQKIQSKYKT